jgi:hypothetical protein
MPTLEQIFFIFFLVAQSECGTFFKVHNINNSTVVAGRGIQIYDGDTALSARETDVEGNLFVILFFRN